MDFQKVVMAVAIGVLILTLGMIGSALSKQRKNAVYPPVLADCPDYWENTSDGTCRRKQYNRGICPDNIKDFSDSTDCYKYDWTNKCDVTWDGISNNPDICDTSS